MYNYSKVKGKIKEIFGTQKAFSQAMGLSVPTISDKLNNKTEWSQSEIKKAAKLIHIEKNDIPIYFFNDLVQLNEQDFSKCDSDTTHN